MLGAWFLIGPSLTRVFIPDDAAKWFLYTTISALCTAACVLLVYIKTTPLQWLEVTDEGVISHEGGNPKTLRWEDIRLFAIASRQRKEEPPRRYQLFRKNAGPGLALDVRRPSRQRLFQFDKPSLPYDEYDRQMDALLSLIAAKTGLPLYDLR
ncbi:MAG TPA: hypothetical protein VFU69_19145 [Ktedonobacterales bacterium]|nr:hypothetical protein [Ktedonobacterales bacterium]